MKKTRKNKKTWWIKYLVIGLFLVLPLLTSLSFWTINSISKGKQLAMLASFYLKNKYGIESQIERIKFHKNKIYLYHIIIYDFEKNKFAQIDTAVVDVQGINSIPGKTRVKALNLINPRIEAIQYKGKPYFNYQYIIWAFQGSSTGKAPKTLVIKNMGLKNAKLHFQRYREIPREYGIINWDDFVIHDIYGLMKNFSSRGPSLRFRIDSLSAIEQNGFHITSFSSDFKADTTEMIFDHAELKTPASYLNGSIKFSYHGWKQFADFISSVRLDGKIDKSYLSFDELKYFSRLFPTREKGMYIKGRGRGTVDNLKISDLQARFGHSSFFQGDLKLVGLPQIAETFMDIKVSNFEFSFSDINRLVPAANIPELLLSSRLRSYRGRFTGFVNDFVTYGEARGETGLIKSDLNFKIPGGKGTPSYKGTLSLIDFDLGKFLNLDQKVGKITFDSEVKGTGISLEDFKTEMTAHAQYFEYNNYRYKNWMFKGTIENKVFKGILHVQDPAMNIMTNGNINFTGSVPTYRLICHVDNIDFYRLHFVKDSLQINGDIDLNLQGKSLNDLWGNILWLNGNLKTRSRNFPIKTMVLSAENLTGSKNLTLNSNLLSAEISGKFLYENLEYSLIKAVSDFIHPSFLTKWDAKKIQEDSSVYNFKFEFFNTALVNELLPVQLVIGDNSVISGYIDNLNKSYRLNTRISQLHYRNYTIDNLIINSSNKFSLLSSYVSAQDIFHGDSLLVENVNISSASNQDTVEFSSYFYASPYRTHLRLLGGMDLTKDSISAFFDSSEVVFFNNETWNLSSGEISISFLPEIHIHSLTLNHNNTSLKVLGTISKDDSQPLRVIFDDVDFTLLEKFIPVNLSVFDGYVNGQLVVYNLLKNMYFDAALVVNPLIYNNEDTLGIFNIYSTYDKQSHDNKIFAQATSLELDEILSVDGYVDFVKDNDIDLRVNVPETRTSNFYPFVKNLVSHLKGTVTATARFYGPYKNYKVSGIAYLKQASFMVDYLKTQYFMEDKITFDENGIYASTINITDRYQNSAILNGAVYHNYFNNFKFDLHLLANDLEALNTEEKDNDIYFGHAYASGKVDITGTLDLIKMDIQIKSEKNSRLNLLAYDDNSLGSYNFIQFTNKNLVRTIESKKENGNTGVIVNLDMEITPQADIQLIFDPITEDIIKARGRGNLSLKIDNFGNSSMFGTYIIETGEYTFTALDIIRRKFVVKEGSTITWKGDPLEADIDIKAGYITSASLNELLPPDIQSDAYKVKVPVEALLYLSGNLYAPTVKLDFEILSSQSISSSQLNIVDQQIKTIKADEQELNKQVISLLVINSFLPSSTSANSSFIDNGLNTNVGSLTSSLVSQWITQITNQFGSKYFEDIQIGLNYQAQNKNYQRELDILLSTSLFNDRVQLSGSYDVENINASFQVDYNVLPDSKLKLKIFSRSDNNPIYQQDINRQGVGIIYRNEFDRWIEIFGKKNKNSIYQ